MDGRPRIGPREHEWLDSARERTPYVRRRPRWWPRWLRGSAGRRPARRHGHRGGARRCRRRGRPHRLRAQQDPHLHVGLHDPVRDRRRHGRQRGRRRPRLARRRRTSRRSTPGCWGSPPPRATTSRPASRPTACGCCRGVGRVLAPGRVQLEGASGDERGARTPTSSWSPPGATPRTMASAMPDGERILTWQQIYDLQELPEKLIVVGSGVTGAELAHAYLGLGSEVVLVSSRDRVLPGEDADAATVIEDVFRRRGMEVMNRSRAASAERVGDGVVVRLEDGREVTGSHVLLAVGSVPQTAGLGPGGGRRRRWAPPGTSRSTGSRARRSPGSTPPATAPGCCRWPPWRRCRAGSRCGTPSATPWRRSTCGGSAPTSSPTPRSPTVGASQKRHRRGRHRGSRR